LIPWLTPDDVLNIAVWPLNAFLLLDEIQSRCVQKFATRVDCFSMACSYHRLLTRGRAERAVSRLRREQPKVLLSNIYKVESAVRVRDGNRKSEVLAEQP